MRRRTGKGGATASMTAEPSPSKPASIWVAQVLLGLHCLLVLVGMVIALLKFGHAGPLASFRIVAWFGGFCAIYALPVLALQLRWRYARGLTIGVLLSLWLTWAYSDIMPPPPRPLVKRLEMTNDAQRGGAAMFTAFKHAAMACLVLTLLFGRPARRYGSKAPHPSGE